MQDGINSEGTGVPLEQFNKFESLNVFAGGIAHDFNNLLTAIMGNAEIALYKLPPTSELREQMLAIKTAATCAADLCRQLRAYTGKSHFVTESLDLTLIVREMAQVLAVSISGKAHLRYHLSDGLPRVRADAAQIRQVIMNLITNASDALIDGEGTIFVTTGTIICDEHYLKEVYLREALPAGCYVFVEVSDTGCGMDEQTQQRVFDPFFTTKFTGRGLGLASALGIIRAHKGAVKIYSQKGKGSTFRLLLPAESAGASEGLTQVPLERPLGRTGSVLIVDDEEACRKLISQMCKALGLSALMATRGQDALRTLNSDPHRVALVSLDLTMPDLSGLEVLRLIRISHATLPVILMSGYSEHCVQQSLNDMQWVRFIHKPFSLEDLSAVVAEVTEREPCKPESEARAFATGISERKGQDAECV